MADQLEIERRLTGGSSPKALFREMFFIPGNRNRALISIVLMICQQVSSSLLMHSLYRTLTLRTDDRDQRNQLLCVSRHPYPKPQRSQPLLHRLTRAAGGGWIVDCASLTLSIACM